jgi:thiosulfate/3-mercaptopyruvate sulfurtransferase
MTALITVDELAARLDHVVLLDVQWNLTVTPDAPHGDDLYATAHLPGAHHLDLDSDLADPPGRGGRHPLPDLARLQARLRECGVEDGSSVVVHDQGPGFGAARAWWVLRWAGLADVRVLDGGLAAWAAEGRPTTTEIPSAATGSVTLRPGVLPTVDAEGAAALGGDGILVDVRAPERYRGETEPIDPVAGHIPGAVNAPTTANALPDGRLRPVDELRERFAALGIHAGSDHVGVYCGSGVTAAHTVLALHEAGVEAALYPGSWSEWITDARRPVATGERA